MTDSAALTLFALGLALAASPGPDSLLIVRNTLVEGRRIGFLTLLGNRFGLCAHVAGAIAGLSVALHNSPGLYLGVRLLGAVYLVYLGASKLVARAKGTPSSAAAGPEVGLAAAAAVRQGLLNNLLNPKVSLFFLSLGGGQQVRVGLVELHPFPHNRASLRVFFDQIFWILQIGVYDSRLVARVVAHGMHLFQGLLDLRCRGDAGGRGGV